MILYNEKLKVLYDMVCRKQHLEHMHTELIGQRDDLLERVCSLKEASLKAQAKMDELIVQVNI